MNLPHEEAVERYGLWAVKILQRCKVHGQTLEPGDEAELSGDVVQQFVLNGRAVVTDKRAKEEAEVINRATALGLPQKIREIVAFAPRKRDSFVRPKEENQTCQLSIFHGGGNGSGIPLYCFPCSGRTKTPGGAGSPTL